MRCCIYWPLLAASLTGCAQAPQSPSSPNIKSASARIGGPCEGCEAVYECPVPFAALNEVDTLSLFHEEGPKLIVSGTVYKSDGTTPAPDVVLYVYQTDRTGRYRSVPDSTVWARRHGSIRGWMKTNNKGQYKFYTVRPGSYTKEGPPAHIHITVKEPGKNEYYIDDFQFDDDPTFTPELRSRQQNRGGDGVLKVERRAGVEYAVRNIALGKNVTDYR